jgi:hypothetical protein
MKANQKRMIEKSLKKGVSMAKIAKQHGMTSYFVSKIRAELISKGLATKSQAQINAHKTRIIKDKLIFNKSNFEVYDLKNPTTIILSKKLIKHYHLLSNGQILIQ